VISIVSEDLLTAIPTLAVKLSPDPSAAEFASISVVAAVVVQAATPLALLAEAEVGYRAIYVRATPGAMDGELAPVSLRVQRTARLAVVYVWTSVWKILKIWGNGSSIVRPEYTLAAPEASE
jgi:hypothetical protein